MANPNPNRWAAWLAHHKKPLGNQAQHVLEFYVEYVELNDHFPTNFQLIRFVERHHPSFNSQSVDKVTSKLKSRGILKQGPWRVNSETGYEAHTLIPGDGVSSCSSSDLDYFGRHWSITQRVPCEILASWTWKDWSQVLGGQRGPTGCKRTLRKMNGLYDRGLVYWDSTMNRMKKKDM